LVASLSVLILISALLVKPIIILCVKEQIKKAVGADRVFIRDCHLRFFHSIFFYDVQIHRQKDFDISAKEISVGFNPWLMMVGASADRFINDLHLSNLAVHLNSFNFDLENGTLLISRKTPGVLLIDKIQWGNWIMHKIKSIVRLDKQKLFFKPLSAEMYNGLIDGDINITIEKEPEYSALFNFNNLDLADFVDAFKLNEKVKIQGLLTGNLVLNGRGKNFKILNGNFYSGRQGGDVIINDTQFLKRLVTQSNQSADFLMESLKNYHYNVGDIKLSMDQGAAVLEINLNGETGKRNFQIRLHNFF